MDSVPVKANASMNSLVRKEVLKDAEDYAASLPSIEGYVMNIWEDSFLWYKAL